MFSLKSNLFDLLLQMFEQSLTNIKSPASSKSQEDEDNARPYAHHMSDLLPLNEHSIRVLNHFEHYRLTKPCYQFLLRMHKLGILNDAEREEVMNQLLFSDSRYITLDEIKWMIRSVLSQGMDTKNLAFLDLVLYHQEDETLKH